MAAVTARLSTRASRETIPSTDGATSCVPRSSTELDACFRGFVRKHASAFQTIRRSRLRGRGCRGTGRRGVGRRRRGGTRGLAGVADVVLLHLAVERRALEAENLRRLLFVPIRPL